MEKRTNALSHAKPSGKYFIASLLILSGLLLLARNMEWISYETFDTIVSWHSLLILIGIGKMMHRRYAGGSLLILIGTYFLLDRLSWLPENLHGIIWPAILVTAGILCLVKTHHRKRWIEIEMRTCGLGKEKERDSRMHPNTENNGQQCQSEDGYLRSDNAFGSIRHVVLDELFKGARIRASFGGTVIDLRHTNLAPGETYIDIDCTCGGIELYIPSDWKVIIQCNAFAGECVDRRWQGANIDQKSTLIIRGNVSFGGIEIKD